MKVKMRGVQFELTFGRVPGGDDGQTHRINHTIIINSRIRNKRKLAAIVHEILHACLWDLDEDAIEEADESMTDALWALGYRGPK